MGHLRKGGYIFYEIENNLKPAEKKTGFKIWRKKKVTFFQLVATGNSPILPQIFIHIHTLQNPELTILSK